MKNGPLISVYITNHNYGSFLKRAIQSVLNQTLKNFEGDLEASIPLGWGIFGWINKALFIPLFNFLSGFLPYGIAIIVMTIVVLLLILFAYIYFSG